MNVDRIQLVPANYDASSQKASYADIAPEMTLPSGKRYNSRKGIWTREQIIRVGVNCISNYDEPTNDQMNQGLSYWDVPKTNEIWNIPNTGGGVWVGNYPDNYNTSIFPNGYLTEEQGRQKGRDASVAHATCVFETEENTHYSNRAAPMWRGFYSTFIPRMIEHFGSRNIPWLVAHNYFNIGLPDEFYLGRKTRQQHKDMLSKNISQMPFTQYSPGGTLELCNFIPEGVYINAPDVGRNNVLDCFYRMLIYRQMGKAGGVFMFPRHEYRPNNPFRTNYTDGYFMKSDKIPLDPNEIMTYSALGVIGGKASVLWGAQSKTANKNFDPDYPAGDQFYLNGQTTPSQMTHYAAPNGEKYYGFDGGCDFAHFGQLASARTFGQTVGQTPKFYDYKIDSAAYRPGHVVDAGYDKEAMLYTEKLNDRLAWMYIKPTADNGRHGLTFRDPDNPGQTFTTEVSGNGPHMGIINL
jgi:hypothetical protein